jgi:hypothetical protein
MGHLNVSRNKVIVHTSRRVTDFESKNSISFVFILIMSRANKRQTERGSSYEKVKKKMQCSLADSSECIGPRSMV